MDTGGYRLGIDFGTSNTSAVLGWPDGRVRPLLFDGSPLLASAVYADAVAGLLVGRDARQAAGAAPERFEPYPKRRIDDAVVLLGDAEVPVVELLAAVLRRVESEADRVIGGAPKSAVLTHPAAWGPRRRGLLRAAAEAAGMPGAELVAEPVAAAAYLVEVAGARVPVGASVLVYDFGAGTFDATVVTRTGDGFRVRATHGLPDAGGLDIDAAIVGYLGAVYANRYGSAWQRLTRPATAEQRRAAGRLWDEVRTAKESLSRLGSVLVDLPEIGDQAPLGRDQLEQIAEPVVMRTVAACRAVLADAGLTARDLHAVFLVGGSSRLPLAATALHRGLGLAALVTEQPELVVAEGSLNASTTAASEPAPAPATPPPPAPEKTAPPPVPASATPSRVSTSQAPDSRPPGTDGRRRQRVILAAAAAVLVLAGAVLAAVLVWPSHPRSVAPPGASVRVDAEVFLRLDVTPQQQAAIQTRLREQPGVVEVRFVSQQEAYQRFISEFPGELASAAKPESLPSSFLAVMRHASDYASVAAAVNGLPGVDSVSPVCVDTASPAPGGEHFVVCPSGLAALTPSR